MAASSRGIIGGFAILAIVLIGLACPRQAEAGAKEGALQDATLPGPKPQVTAQDEPGAKEGAVQDPTRPGPKPQMTVDLGGGVTMELILIPPGTFDMGSDKGQGGEKPVHKVTLKKGFYIGKYEVTQEQWQAVMGANPSHFKDPKKPVEQVTWNACRDFVAKLSEKTGRKFSLPSEAEWEYACRAGSTTEFCYGDAEAGLGEYAWYSGKSGNMTHLVGQKKPNQFGLFDMHGNVSEWCEDVSHDSYEGAPTDGSAWVEGGNQGLRVVRGGSWLQIPTLCRSALRNMYAPASDYYLYGYGCRVVLRDF
jgi:formylglycine-generating enzyme required for sulfatase activity